jgi:hypothetical protein
MDARLIFGLGVSVIGLAIRWRFPAVHRFVATFVAGAGAGLLVWAAFPSVWWPYAVVGALALGVVLVGLDWLLSPRPKPSPPPKLQEYRQPTVTARATGGAIIELDDVVSSADTFAHAGEGSKITATRVDHEPKMVLFPKSAPDSAGGKDEGNDH